MTAMELAMTDDAPTLGRLLRRLAALCASVILTAFGVGLVFGMLAAHNDKGGGPFDVKLIGLLAIAALVAAGGIYIGYRAIRAFAGSGAETSRERRNRLVVFLCGGLGAAIGLALTWGAETPLSVFSNAPISPALALVLVFGVAVVLPILSYYWHRRVADEQEAAAYGKGALLGIYAYWIGAPTWWLLWRGGLVPAPDGIAIYFVTIVVMGTVWLWAKYR